MEGTFDAAATGFRHPPPVFKGFGDQGIGGNGCNGLVPVAYPYRVDGDLDNLSIGIITGHLYPVTHPDHIGAGQLDGGDKTEDGVAKHQHGHCGQAAHDRDESPRGAIGEDCDQKDNGKDIDNNPGRINIAADGFSGAAAQASIDGIDRVEQRRN